MPLFKNIENKNSKKLIYPYKFHPLGPEQLRHEIHIVPFTDVQVLRIFFPTEDLSLKYKAAVGFYIDLNNS